jgi:hypothetical protein
MLPINQLTSHFIALAATDAPHNESNNINCGSCHGEGLLNSPFWGETMSYDQLCLNCHKASSGRIVKTVMDTIMGGTEGATYGTTQSHSTHTENDSDDLKGPFIMCCDCHDTNDYPFFKSGTDSDRDENIIYQRLMYIAIFSESYNNHHLKIYR